MTSIDYSVNMEYNDFRSQIMTVEELVYRFDVSDAINSVSYLRRPTSSQSSRIIESLLLGMPQPMLYVDDSRTGFVVIEGAEHLYAYYSFCKKGMSLKSLYFKKEQYEGLTFYDLSPLAQSNILNTKIMVSVLNPGLTPHERFGVYLCLKSRLDSASLSWCRSKIYPNEYQQIKELARKAITGSRSGSMESALCYMLVGCFYESFLDSKSLNQIDAVANRIMEQVSRDGTGEKLYHDMGVIVEAYQRYFESHIIQPRVLGLYLSVFYHLYHRNGEIYKLERTDRLAPPDKSTLMHDDSAENFCREVDNLLQKYK